jgi:hypothetical protein
MKGVVKMDRLQKEKDVAKIFSVLAYVGIFVALYSAFLLAGIDQAKALIESVVISATTVTLVILYLFGKIWKKELDAG